MEKVDQISADQQHPEGNKKPNETVEAALGAGVLAGTGFLGCATGVGLFGLGVILCATLVGAIIGIPMIIAGLAAMGIGGAAGAAGGMAGAGALLAPKDKSESNNKDDTSSTTSMTPMTPVASSDKGDLFPKGYSND